MCVLCREGWRQACWSWDFVCVCVCVCVCFPVQRGPSNRPYQCFRCLEIQPHSTNLETRGVCVCVCVSHSVSPPLNSDQPAEACSITSHNSAYVYVYTIFPAAGCASAASDVTYKGYPISTILSSTVLWPVASTSYYMFGGRCYYVCLYRPV